MDGDGDLEVLDCEGQIDRIEFAVAVPVAFVKGGVMNDPILIFTHLEDQNHVV